MAFDIETTGLNPRTERFIALQFMQDNKEPVIVDMRELDVEEVGRIVRPLFDTLLICGHNLKFDLGFLFCQMGIRAARIFDTYLAEVVLYSADPSVKYALDKVVARRGIELAFPMEKKDREWFIGLDKREEEWVAPFPERQILYMENDVKAILPIVSQQEKALEREQLTKTAQVEFDVCPVLVKMEADGVPIHVDGWRAEIEKHREQAKELEQHITAIIGPSIQAHSSSMIDQAQAVYDDWQQRKEAYEKALRETFTVMDKEAWGSWGRYKIESLKGWREQNSTPPKPKAVEVNINSQPQLLIAFKALKIQAQDTGDKTLAKLEGKHEVVRLLRRYRKEKKFVAAYGESLLAERDTMTGRFHFGYQQMVQTGRMSASRIQQIPKKGEGVKLREQVRAEPGHCIITCDYPAIEMRILAEITYEDKLIDMFCRGADIHSEIARDLFDLADDVNPKTERAKAKDGRELGKTCREVAKVVEYGTVYGIGPRGLADTLGCSVDDAKQVLADFFETYGCVDRWLKRIKRQAIASRQTRTMGGRARYYKVPSRLGPDATREERQIYREEIGSIERAAGNAPIQGTNADMVKTALVKLYRDLDEVCLLDRVKMIAAVHDEIVLEAPETIAQIAATLLSKAMEYGARKYLKMVPVDCSDVDIGPCWHKA